jgi:hypothetical protein
LQKFLADLQGEVEMTLTTFKSTKPDDGKRRDPHVRRTVAALSKRRPQEENDKPDRWPQLLDHPREVRQFRVLNAR